MQKPAPAPGLHVKSMTHISTAATCRVLAQLCIAAASAACQRSSCGKSWICSCMQSKELKIHPLAATL